MGYISTAMGHRFSALLMSLMALQVVLVDRNTKALFSSKATEILTKLYFYIQRRNTHCWWISQALNHEISKTNMFFFVARGGIHDLLNHIKNQVTLMTS